MLVGKKVSDWNTNMKIIENVRVIHPKFLEFKKKKYSRCYHSHSCVELKIVWPYLVEMVEKQEALETFIFLI